MSSETILFIFKLYTFRSLHCSECRRKMLLMMVSIESRDVGDICGYDDGPLAPETRKVMAN